MGELSLGGDELKWGDRGVRAPWRRAHAQACEGDPIYMTSVGDSFVELKRLYTNNLILLEQYG